MKILVLTGSPHQNGSSAYLAQNYISGAKKSGHDIVRFDTAKMNIRPCSGCNHCKKNEGICVHKDSMEEIYPHLISADRIVLVTPLYYFGMTAYLKSVLDRFHAINSELRKTEKEFDLLAVCGDKNDWAMDAMVAHFNTIGMYLNWKCLPPLLAYGCYVREDIEKSDYGEKARAKGMS